ncbi:MAG: O-antigen ligase family protein [Peptococcaceae bacterium]|jgi:O-antigen ligase|nr:O-antigen ligase family protein [Peptococcaceae bacterium]
MVILQWSLLALSIILLAVLGRKRPSLLIPLLTAAAALDISITWYPSLGALGTALGGISLARLTAFALILTALILWFRDWNLRQEGKELLHQGMFWALLIYLVLGGVSVLYAADRMRTVIECVRLFTLFALFLAVCLLAERHEALWPLRVVHTVGVILTPLVIFEQVTGHFIWQQQFAAGMIARPPATFIDANILARYLILALVANIVLQYYTQERRARVVYRIAMLGLAGALAATFSRSGYLTLVVVLLALAVWTRTKKILLPVGLLAVAGVALLALNPGIWQRLLTLKEGISALDAQRQYLVQAAWAMFQAHPLRGVGLGSFHKVFMDQYVFMQTVEDGATLSHTSLLTIAAELGALGLAALAGVWAALAGLYRQASRQLGGENRMIAIAYILWILTIFISSQSESRFFEDPLVWVSCGMLYRLAARNWRIGRW